MIEEVLYALASCQCGLFSRQQVLAAGGYDQLIERRLASGRWLLVHPGVYSLPGWPSSWKRDLWAMYLALGPDAVVSHESAASIRALHPFPKFGQIELSVPHGKHVLLPRSSVHQARDLRPEHIEVVDGLRVTSPGRTLCDLAGVSHRERLSRAIEQADLDKKCAIRTTMALYEELRAPGKRGFRMLGEILAVRAPGFVVPESELEGMFRRLVRRFRIPEPAWQVPLPWDPTRRADAGWASRNALIELDSRSWHARIDQMTADRRRDRAARRHGHTIYRFTYEEVRYQPRAVADELWVILNLAADPLEW